MPDNSTEVQVKPSIDDLSKKIQDTKKEVNQLKNWLNVYSIEEQDRRLSDIEESILDCTQDLQQLESETLSETEKKELKNLKSKIEELKSSKEQLKQQIERETRSEIETLSQEVSQTQASQTPEQSEWKEKWRLWRQRDAITSKEEWKEHTWKNILRVAWWIWLVAWTVALFKNLFGKKDKEKTTWWESKEKKKFRDRPIWKVLKWTWIWTAIYYIAHGIKTWKWGLKDFFNWNSDTPTNSAQEVYNNYSELAQEDPEKYAEYEKIGENINLMYDQIWDTERNYFWDNSQVVMWSIWNDVEEKKLQKNEKFEHIDTKWMVVYSLDNFYSDVWQLLSYWGVEKYIRSKTISEYKSKIKSFGAEWFDKAMVPFLSWFANFTSFWIVSKDTAQQKMDKYFKWISENEWDCLAQLDLFFRQYTKVLTYMADKRNAIAMQEAKKIISTQWYDGNTWPTDEEKQKEMLYEAINDIDWVEKNLKWTTYGAFMSSNILWAHRILKNEWLDGSEMTEELEDIVSGVDDQTEKIIWGFDDNALKKAETKINNGQSLDSSDKAWLHKIAQNVLDDMWDQTKPWWIYSTFDYVFESFNLWDSDKQTILQESWLSKCFNDTTSAIQNLQSEISSNPTKENVELMKNLVWQYTSLKKELAVAVYAIHEARESKDGVDNLVSYGKLVWGFFSHFFGSMKKLFQWKSEIGDFINIFAWLVVTWGIVEILGKATWKSWVLKLWRYTRKTWLLPCVLVELWLWHTRWGWAVKNRINDIAKTNPTKAENLMKKKILEGVLSPDQVWKILTKNQIIKNNLCIYSSSSNEVMFREVVKNIFGDENKDIANLFVKYYDKINCRSLVSYANIDNVHWLKNWQFTVKYDEKAFTSLENFDKEFEKLWKNTVQKSYFEAMLKKVKWADDFDLLTDLMKNDEFKKAIKWDNLKLLKKLRISELKKLHKTWQLNDFAKWKIKLDQLMKEVPRLARQWRTASETVETASDIRKAFNKEIDEAADKLVAIVGDENSNMVTIVSENLKKLKTDTSLLEEDMECFTKFMREWFDAKLIPEMQKLITIKTTLDNWEMLWERFKKLLTNWDYAQFRRILKNKKYWKSFEKIPVDDIIRSFDNILNKAWWIWADTAKSLFKSFMKIVAKVL